MLEGFANVRKEGGGKGTMDNTCRICMIYIGFIRGSVQNCTYDASDLDF